MALTFATMIALWLAVDALGRWAETPSASEPDAK